MRLVKHDKCRVCGFETRPVIDLGEQHLQGSFLKAGKPEPCLDKVPMSLSLCRSCTLLQMDYTVAPEILYRNYWYRSGTNRTMKQHLSMVAHESAAMLESANASVLDIGCNDGTLLKSYPSHFYKCGIDPSDVDNSDFEFIHDFFPSKQLSRQFDIITSIAMFYDLDDPVTFARSVKEVLSPNGIWVIEVSYLPSMLSMNSYDTICAEHLEYYSLHSLRMALMFANLWPFRAVHSPINGGSVRVYVTHSDRFNHLQHPATMYDLFDEEILMGLRDTNPYVSFQHRIEQHRNELRDLLYSLKNDGKTIHIYGASTKGNTILQWCGIDGQIVDCASDRNPNKVGARIIGSNIPIVSEEESRAMKPDYYLVLPWHFAEEFIEREREMILNGTSLIFPLPSVHTVDKVRLCQRQP